MKMKNAVAGDGSGLNGDDEICYGCVEIQARWSQSWLWSRHNGDSELAEAGGCVCAHRRRVESGGATENWEMVADVCHDSVMTWMVLDAEIWSYGVRWHEDARWSDPAGEGQTRWCLPGMIPTRWRRSQSHLSSLVAG